MRDCNISILEDVNFDSLFPEIAPLVEEVEEEGEVEEEEGEKKERGEEGAAVF